MKRNIRGFILLAVLMVCCVVVADAADEKVKCDDIYYSLNKTLNTATVTWGGEIMNSGTTEYKNSINIPKSINYESTDYAVVGIGNFAFCECTGLTSVSVPSSVKNIGGRAFTNCTGLTSVTFEDGSSLSSIGEYAFSGCESLVSICIPAGVNSIGENVFTGCKDLMSMTVANGNTTYDSRDDCNAIIRKTDDLLIAGCMNTKIPESVTGIGEYAFYDCSDLTSLVIPEGVESIGDYAFWGCSGLTTLSIPASVGVIGKCTFAGCSGLTGISVAEGNTTYESQSGYNAIIRQSDDALIVGCRNTVIPANVTRIEDYAFFGRTGLTSITIPEGVEGLGVHVFEECTDLVSVVIPASMKSIGQRAFYDCTSLESVEFAEGSELEMIDWYAFYGCTSLGSVTIPASVKYVAGSVFESCTALASVTFDDGTEGSNLESIGEAAFRDCISLASVTILSSTPPDLGVDAWQSIKDGATLFVPGDAVETYMESWSALFNIEKAIPKFSLAVSSVGWASLYHDQALDIPDGARVYYASNVEGETVTLTEIRNQIPAKTAVIVNAAEGTVTFRHSEETVEQIAGTNLFKGLLTDAALAEIQSQESGMTIYTLCEKDVDGTPVFKEYTGETLAANKMYLPLVSSASNIKFRIAGNDFANGVNAVPQRKVSSKAVSLDGIEINSNSYYRPFIREGKLFIDTKK